MPLALFRPLCAAISLSAGASFDGAARKKSGQEIPAVQHWQRLLPAGPQVRFQRVAMQSHCFRALRTGLHVQGEDEPLTAAFAAAPCARF